MKKDIAIAPILLLIYKRSDTAIKVVERLRLIKPRKVFVAADGPKEGRLEDQALCEQTRAAVLAAIDWDCEVKTLFRDANLGCRKAVSSAISWFFSEVEAGIILEEDCYPSESFFPFCSHMLEQYKDDSRIGEISGHNSLGTWTGMGTGYHFSKTGSCWGWASWRRAWENFDINMTVWPEVRDKELLLDKIKLYDEAVYYTATFNSVFEGRIDSWAYIWNMYKILNSYLCIVPSVNLIRNIGFGEIGTHTQDLNATPSFRFQLHEIDMEELKVPTYFMVDEQFDQAVFNEVLMFNRKFSWKEKAKKSIKEVLNIH